jgi:hypothetical protein
VCCKSLFKLPARCNFFTYVYESELWADDGGCSYGRFISASPYSLAPRIGPDSDEYMVHQLFPCASLWTCDFCLPAPSAVEYEDTDPPHSETRSIGVNARVRESAQGSEAKPGPLESLKMASGRVVRQPRYVQRMTSNAPWLRAHGHVWDGFCAAPIRFKLQRFPNGLIPESHHTGTIYVKSVFFFAFSKSSSWPGHRHHHLEGLYPPVLECQSHFSLFSEILLDAWWMWNVGPLLDACISCEIDGAALYDSVLGA